MQSATINRVVILDELVQRFKTTAFTREQTCDDIPTLWTASDAAHEVLRYLKEEVARPYRMLYDLTAVDERVRRVRQDQPPSDFTVVYHLLSFDRNEDLRLKVSLTRSMLSLRTITDLWPAANWYEREVWDMFGIPSRATRIRRILMPRTWAGHPLRKDHPARATERVHSTYRGKQEAEQEALSFRPEEWGMSAAVRASDFMFLNLGPAHPGTHGIFA